MVYFMRIGRGPETRIKIGYSEDVRARASCIRSTLGEQVSIIGVMPGGYTEEKLHHEMFAALRMGRSEYFQADPMLISYIRHHSRRRDWPARRPPRRDDVSVPFDGEIYRKAKMIAVHRGIRVSEYISELTREQLTRDYKMAILELEGSR